MITLDADPALARLQVSTLADSGIVAVIVPGTAVPSRTEPTLAASTGVPKMRTWDKISYKLPVERFALLNPGVSLAVGSRQDIADSAPAW